MKKQGKEVILVCLEVAGGLTTPRIPVKWNLCSGFH